MPVVGVSSIGAGGGAARAGELDASHSLAYGRGITIGVEPEVDMKVMQLALTVVLALGLLAAPLAAEAQQTGKLPRIGVLGTAPSPATEVLRQGLRDLGWIEDQTITIEWRWSRGRPELYAEHTAEFLRLNVNLILAPGSAQTEAARRVTTTIPIVFTLHDDPVGVGHVATLARPGGNITGVAQLLTELSAKELEILKEAIPGATRVGVLWNSAFPSHRLALKALEDAGTKLGIQLRPVAVQIADDLPEAFSTLARERVQAVVVLTATIFIKERARLAELALKNRLPAVFATKEHVQAGGLLSYGPNLNWMVRRSAVYIDRILRGRKPADLPVEQAATFELVINLKTAKALSLAIPQSVLARADEVID